LSYTAFEYGDISVSKNTLKGDDTLTVSVPVTNAGKYSGEEVVQLYISDPAASVARPVKELKGFQKIRLEAGEKKTVEFTVTTNDLKFFNSDLVYDWEPGEFIVHIGTNSKDVQSMAIDWLL
jgi:beta-glucosidase